MVRAIVLTLTVLCLHLAVFAQGNDKRDREKPTNQTPAVGTGGPEGGPTGLFTIYDGSTLRRGEFTFSIAYSNYDRDPGNADFVDVPLSFNVGINDHLELFFKTNGYRGVKVNNPQNLSGFYLPNSQLFCGTTLCSGTAVVLAPSGPLVGTLVNTAVFRPVNNQPFVQFPFTGGSAGTFGLTPGQIGQQFGFPGFNAQLGPPVVQPNSGTFGTADNFPGVGSPVGSILPGVVLATTVLPATALTLPIRVPLTFTIAPTYLPDAPFINRLYGESSFNNFVVGAKIRFTGPNNPLGVALIPFYRWYPDKADDFSGFNQMQRGAGPGGDIGDFGLVGVVDGRLGRHVNVSANVGYILNSNPKGAGGDFVLLDRPDELIAGVGFDFPVNEHFQPIFEVRSTQYVAGRTPNAFNNNPVDALAGVKIYPRRWFGFGFAYRRHLNPQDQDHFEPADFNIPIQQITNVNVVGRGLVVVPGTSRAVTSQGFPIGFNFSEDEHGFITQFWIGRRNARTVPVINAGPTVSTSLRRLTFGMFIWDSNVREEDRQQIRMALKRAPEYIEKICIFWRANSLECRYLKEAVDALGPENVDNGVVFSVGPTQTQGAAAETNVGCVKSRTKTKGKATDHRITVVLPKETVNSESLPIPLFHEGSHVADGLKWWRSGCKQSSSPSVYETEFKAYIVSSLTAQARKPDATLKFALPGGGLPGQNPFLPETLTLYSPGLTVGDLRALRTANITKFLARPKDAGGAYGVTPESPGGQAFGSGSLNR